MMVLTKTDKIFWLRVGFGALAGVASELLFGTDYVSGVLLAMITYFASYYLVRWVWGSQFKVEEATKMYTAGLGSFVLLFLFLYILLFTLGVHSLNL